MIAVCFTPRRSIYPGGRIHRRRRVRLLFVSPHYGTVGGVRLIVDALAREARAAGHEVSYLRTPVWPKCPMEVHAEC